jgi:hypothetical protein
MGVLGRIRSDLDGRLLTSFYDAKVFPHLQYCLMVRDRYYVDHLYTEYGFLKVGTYIGSSSGFVPRSFEMECSPTVRRRCLEGWMSPMAMVPGLLGQD